MTNEAQGLKTCPNPWCPVSSPPLPVKGKSGWSVLCGCGVQTWRQDTEDEAIAAWSTRTPDPRIAELEAALTKIAKRGFNCLPHQHGMAAAECARQALKGNPYA